MRLFPARDNARVDDVEVFSDLDAMLTESISFRFCGRIHKIDPITTQKFAEFVDAQSRLDELSKTGKMTPTECIDACFKVIQSVIPSITLEDIEKAQQHQVVAIFEMIRKTITGEIYEEEKKKTLLPQYRRE